MVNLLNFTGLQINTRTLTGFDDYRRKILQLFVLAGVFAQYTFMLATLVSSIVQRKPFILTEVEVLFTLIGTALIFLVFRFQKYSYLFIHAIPIIMLLGAVVFYLRYQDVVLFSIVSTVIIFLAGLLFEAKSYALYICVTVFLYFALIKIPVPGTTTLGFLTTIGFAIASSVVATTMMRKLVYENNRKSLEIEQFYQHEQELLRRIAHKLKTPVAVLQTEVEMVNKKHQTPETKRLINTIQQIGQGLNDLAALSAVSMSKNVSPKEQVKLVDIITKIVSDAEILTQRYMQQYNQRRTITWQTELSADTTWIYINTEQIREVLLNIIDNAIRHNSERELVNIDISLTATPKSYVITIKDDGDGISESVMKEINSIGQQTSDLDFVSKHLGIQIAMNLVAANDGTMEINSHLGDGTKIAITLPKP